MEETMSEIKGETMTIPTPEAYQPEVIVWPEPGKHPIHLLVPNDQAWLYAMLERQEKILNGIKTACTIIAVLILLIALISACSALGLR
jgi:hypothetical protein